MLRIADHPRYTSAELDVWRHRLRVAAADLPDAVVVEIVRLAGERLVERERQAARRAG